MRIPRDRLIRVIVTIGLMLSFLIALLLQGCAGSNDWRTLQAIHGDSLKHFQYVSDKDLYSKEEYWAKPGENVYRGVKLGDCEDYALWVQDKLKSKGFASIVVRNYTHAYLVVNDWIIDSKYKEIKRKQKENISGGNNERL